jgi:hypothetical protein
VFGLVSVKVAPICYYLIELGAIKKYPGSI